MKCRPAKWFHREWGCLGRKNSICLSSGFPRKSAVCFQGIFCIGRERLYAVATDIDQKTDKELLDTEVDKFLCENGLERDTSRAELGNVITSPLAQEIMGYSQMDYYTPIKAKK